jgi:peptidoglycan hydrolase-like protein with peptidoglycan-binding domain
MNYNGYGASVAPSYLGSAPSFLDHGSSLAGLGDWNYGAVSRPVLSKGDEGAGVRDLQEKLYALGSVYRNYLAYTNAQGQTVYVDGDFGDGTESAVKTCQRSAGLRTTGVVGSSTWSAVDRRCAPTAATTTGTAVQPESQEDEAAAPSAWERFTSGLTEGLDIRFPTVQATTVAPLTNGALEKRRVWPWVLGATALVGAGWWWWKWNSQRRGG